MNISAKSSAKVLAVKQATTIMKQPQEQPTTGTQNTREERQRTPVNYRNQDKMQKPVMKVNYLFHHRQGKPSEASHSFKQTEKVRLIIVVYYHQLE